MSLKRLKTIVIFNKNYSLYMQAVYKQNTISAQL
jgi:hypothetical protein